MEIGIMNDDKDILFNYFKKSTAFNVVENMILSSIRSYSFVLVYSVLFLSSTLSSYQTQRLMCSFFSWLRT